MCARLAQHTWDWGSWLKKITSGWLQFWNHFEGRRRLSIGLLNSLTLVSIVLMLIEVEKYELRGVLIVILMLWTCLNKWSQARHIIMGLKLLLLLFMPNVVSMIRENCGWSWKIYLAKLIPRSWLETLTIFVIMGRESVVGQGLESWWRRILISALITVELWK